jgi:methylated-DNA-[protein]-cysteine S-methyltransferase
MITDSLEASLAAFAPSVHPPLLDGGDVRYRLVDTAVGRLLLAARPDGTLLASSYTPADADADRLLDRLARVVSPRVLRGGDALDRGWRELDEYLAGRRRRFEVPVDLTLATGFQRLVLGGLDAVGYGSTTSYAELARRVGRPSAARAVGAALGANPMCLVLPCHRVIASSGALTGYAGGLTAKERLLALEASMASSAAV